MRLPLSGEFHHQTGFIQPEGFEVLFRPQIPLQPQPGQGSQHGAYHGLVSLGVQGAVRTQTWSFLTRPHLVLTRTRLRSLRSASFR